MKTAKQLAQQFDARNLGFVQDIPAITEIAPLEPGDAALIRDTRAEFEREKTNILQRRRRAMHMVNEECRRSLEKIERWGSVAAIAEKFNTTTDEVRHILGVRS